MKKGLIITLPQSDDVTEYLAVFSKPITDECERMSIKFHELKKEKVNKLEFESSLKSYDYNFVILNGHGEENAVTGHQNKTIIKKGENDGLLNKKITYARSCWAATGLGSCYAEDEESCFIGYNIPFMFLMDTTRATNPIKDKIAEIFFKTSNLLPIGILKGQTAEQANNNSKRAMLKGIKKALTRGDKSSHAVAEILWNPPISRLCSELAISTIASALSGPIFSIVSSINRLLPLTIGKTSKSFNLAPGSKVSPGTTSNSSLVSTPRPTIL